MTENTCSNQSSILDQLRAIPEGKQVRFTLRRPDGSEFTHVSAIDTGREAADNGFDSQDKSIALASYIQPRPDGANEWWASYANTRGMCSIVTIEQLAPPLPDLETLRKWVADGTQVRIEYDNDPATVGYIGASPVTCKLLGADEGLSGLAIQVPDGPGRWNMFLDRAKGCIRPCRPLVTSITPVVEKAQTAEEIDTIMQRAAKSGAQVEAITATGDTHIGDVEYCGYGGTEPYRVPANGEPVHSYWWLGSAPPDAYRRIVSVRELTPKQTEQEMLALLQQAEREGNHVEATMADGSKRTGAVTHVTLFSRGALKAGELCYVNIGNNGVSFGSFAASSRIAAVKLLPREEKRPVVQHCEAGTVTFSIVGPSAITTALGFSGPFSLAPSPTLDIKMEEKTHITPTCCADVAPYIGRRVRVEDGIEGILTGCGIDPDDGEYWFGLDGENPDNEFERCYAFPADGYGKWTFELLPDEPAPGNLMIEPKCPADLEPYLGRRVRVLAGPERELVREGILTAPCSGLALWLGIDGSITWAYGPDRLRSTLVEVLPELPAADDDETSIEDESDDAVSAGYMPSEPVLLFGTVMMQVDGVPELVKIEPDGNLTAQSGRRLCLTTEGDAITAAASAGRIGVVGGTAAELLGFVPVKVESKLTLAKLLACAPPPSEVRAYEAFQLTVREAMLTGLVRY
jgi:hypothetical protein